MMILNNIFINSPLEQFEVTNLIGLNAPILGYLNITLTNLALYALLVLTLIVGLHLLANNNNKLLIFSAQINQIELKKLIILDSRVTIHFCNDRNRVIANWRLAPPSIYY